MVTGLFCLLGLPERALPFDLNSTVISPPSPGGMGSFGQLGTVQPQVERALEIVKGISPVFLKLNV